MEPGVSIIPVVFWSKSGLAAARPAATGLRNGSIWVSTDTKDIDQVQGGSWLTILDYSLLTMGVSSGLILMWHGSIATIPSGFLICDGNNSTPDLLRKFVQGVDTAGTNPGATGGEATHVLSEAELAAHTHIQRAYSGSGSGSSCNLGGNQTNNINSGDTVAKGSDSAHENEPEFYDIAFLMKT